MRVPSTLPQSLALLVLLLSRPLCDSQTVSTVDVRAPLHWKELQIPPARQEAAERLKSRVPALKVSFDPVSESASFVRNPNGFLTDPEPLGDAPRLGDPETTWSLVRSQARTVLSRFVDENRDLFGHGSEHFPTAKIARDYSSKHNGLHTFVWQQQYDSLEIHGAYFKGHVTADGAIACVSSTFVGDPGAAARQGTPNYRQLLRTPTIQPINALGLAALSVGETFEVQLSRIRVIDETTQRMEFGLVDSSDHLKSELQWFPLDSGTMRLSWAILFRGNASGELVETLVDAENGTILYRASHTSQAAQPGSYKAFSSDSPTPMSPGHPTPLSTQPPLVPQDTIAFTSSSGSPNGWLNTPAPGQPWRTIGNNADVHLDLGG